MASVPLVMTDVRRPPQEATDPVSLAKAGDTEAFEQLYRENSGRVYALCLRITRDPSQAEDLTQDAFIRAWRKLNSFRGDSAFSTWLHRLTVNLVLTHLRSQSRRAGRVIYTDDLEVFDKEGRPLPDAAGGADGLPAWSVVAVFAGPAGGFTVVY